MQTKCTASHGDRQIGWLGIDRRLSVYLRGRRDSREEEASSPPSLFPHHPWSCSTRKAPNSSPEKPEQMYEVTIYVSTYLSVSLSCTDLSSTRYLSIHDELSLYLCWSVAL